MSVFSYIRKKQSQRVRTINHNISLLVTICVLFLLVCSTSASEQIIPPVVQGNHYISPVVSVPAISEVVYTPEIESGRGSLNNSDANTHNSAIATVNRSEDVGRGASNSFITRWGSYGYNDGYFEDPEGVALSPDGSRVYVADTDNDRIQVFNPNGKFITKWGSYGYDNGEFHGPYGIAISSDGARVYVADFSTRIQVFDPNGNFITTWGSSGYNDGEFHSPIGVTVSPDGSRVYVADSGNRRIQVFDSNGNFITKWGDLGSNDGEFYSPEGVAVSPDGARVYVVDSDINRIQVFNPNGNFITKWGSYGTNDGEFSYPSGIAVSPDGSRVYVADTDNGRIQVFDPNGNFITKWGSYGSDDGEFDDPRGVAVSPDGSRVYVADTDNGRIQVFGASHPSISSITPSVVKNSKAAIMTLTGRDFQTGAKVKLTRSGYSPISATNQVVTPPSKIACTLPITGKKAGTWNVVVTNPDGAISTTQIKITSSPWPTISGITPSTALNTSPVSITNLAGRNFQKGAGVKLVRSGYPSIVARNVVIASPTQIVCKFPITGKIAGAWNIVVTNPDGGSGTKTKGFVIKSSPDPIITSITPSTALNSGPVSVTIKGKNFGTGAKVMLGNEDIQATNVVVVSPTKITCKLPLTGITPGPRNIYVQNLNGQISPGFKFIVTGPGPYISSVTPSNAFNSGPVTITLNGWDFQDNAKVKLTRTGYPSIVATNVVVSYSYITCTLPITGKEAGAWNVTVKNPYGGSGTITNGFKIRYPSAPNITRITPSTAFNSGPVTITNLAGKNFQDGVAVKLVRPGCTSIVAKDVIVASPTQIVCTFPITGKKAGKWSVLVTDLNKQTTTLSNAFTVKAAGKKPTITIIAPKTGLSNVNTKVTITGNNFRKKANVQIISGSDAKKASISSLVSTKIVCTFPTKGAKAGMWTVKITNTDGTSVKKSSAFRIKEATSSSVSKGSNDSVTGMQPSVVLSSTISGMSKPSRESQSGSSVVLPSVMSGMPAIPGAV